MTTNFLNILRGLDIPIRKGGFTVIELLVIIGVLFLLLTTFTFYTRIGENQISLLREQAKIIEIISRAKFLSIGTYGRPEVPCGYGVYFEAPRTFILFKDLATDCATSDKRYSGESEIEASFQLDSKVIFNSLSLSDILFVPPDPTVIITPPQDLAMIIIRTIDGNNSARIKVNSAGQISTE